MMIRILILATLAAAVAAGGCGRKKAVPVTETPAPGVVEPAVRERNLADLMSHFPSKIVSPQPWAGYWWPYVAGGIATVGYDAMSTAEKYDAAYLGDMKSRGLDASKFQSMAEWERAWHGPGASPKIEAWWGHCNGWAASSLLLPEPRMPRSIGGITFEVRDQKALLSESWLVFSGDFVGTRVNEKRDYGSAAFWDVVPAQFHLVLTNIVGKQNRGIILDRHAGHEIWNQPLVAYSIDPVKPEDYLGPHPSFPDIYRVNMVARLWWANDNVAPDDVTPRFNLDQLMNEFNDYFFPGRQLRYELWLDGPLEFDSAGNLTKSGDILLTKDEGRYVGGVWKNGSDPGYLIHTHPDYLWMPFGQQHATYFSDIVLWDKNPRLHDSWVRENIAVPLREQ